MDALGETTALVAPALPSEGRTTVGGRQHIGDTRLELDSAGISGGAIDLIERFGCRTGRAVHHLHLDTVRAGTGVVARFLDTTGDGIVVADAETEADLFTIASAVAGSSIRVLCGSAGFARQCARALPLECSPHPGIHEGVEAGPVLIVAGSTHPATAAQVDHLRRAGCPVVRPSDALLNGDSTEVDTARSLAEHLANGHAAILTTTGMNHSSRGPAFVASQLAAIVVEIMDHIRLSGLVISGGDVAANVLSGLGATVMHLQGEVRPAMPWSLVEPASSPPMLVVTKAGSFGEVDALEASLDFLMSRLADR
jgi:uncharacterized protein YgbK (DUF1537 family)